MTYGSREREPSDRFLDALAAFLEADAPETGDALKRALGALVRAWRKAGQECEAQGRPGTPARQEVATP